MNKDSIKQEYKQYCEVTKMAGFPALSFEDFLLLRIIEQAKENKGLIHDYDCIVKEKHKLEIKLKGVKNDK